MERKSRGSSIGVMYAAWLAAVLVSVLACAPIAPATVAPSPPAPAAAAPSVRTDRVGNVLAPAVSEDTWRELAARPITLPTIAADADCPLTPMQQWPSGTGALAGSGPVYSVGNGIRYGPRATDGLFAAKILWVAVPEYKGPALIRGRALDGSSSVHFANSRAVTTLRFELDTGVRAAGSEQGWRYLPSTVNVQAPGCYGFQIDGPGWTTTVVMRATP